MRSHSAEKVGRNDPCPCGSGNKYKRCCLQTAAAPTNDAWRRQHEANDVLTSELMRFARRKFDDRKLQAWIDYNQMTLPPLLDKFPGEEQIFLPYFLYDWHPENPRPRPGRSVTAGIVLSAFLDEKHDRLSEFEQQVLIQLLTQPLSFYEVVRCDKGHGMRLRDVLIGGETEVEEHAGSEQLRSGDLIYAQICCLPGVNTLGRMAPFPIEPAEERKS